VCKTVNLPGLCSFFRAENEWLEENCVSVRTYVKTDESKLIDFLYNVVVKHPNQYMLRGLKLLG
jgi:hypothetical protein